MDIVRAILYKIPEAKFSQIGSEYSGLTWLDDRPKPTEEELEEAYAEMIQAGVDPLKGEDWEGLRTALVTSPLFQKCYVAAKTNQSVFMSFYKVEQVVLTTQIKEALEFFLNDLRNEMGSSITAEDITELNTLLKEKGFKLKLS